MSLLHRILYSFTAEEEGELSVKAGDLVVLKNDGGETAEGWTLVQTTTAPIRFGFVPSDYLQSVAAPSSSISAASSAPISSSPLANSTSTTSSSSANKSGFVVGTSPSLESSSFMQRLNGGVSGSGAGSQPISSLISSPIVSSSNNYSLTGSYTASSGSGMYSSGGVGLMQYSAPAPSSSSYSQALVLSEAALQASASTTSTSVAEEFSQLFSSHEEWFRAATTKRQDVYKQLVSEASDIARSLQESEVRSSAVVSRMSELESLIQDEKRRWSEKLSEVR